jgi:hypothetical protein
MGKTVNFSLLFLTLLGACGLSTEKKAISEPEKIRTVILTDMTHDDGNSLIRYLYYSSFFDLEGLIVTNQLPDYKHSESGPWDKAMGILSAYKDELPQLRKHDPDLPDAEELLAVTKRGRGTIPIIWLTNTLKFSNNIADRYVTSEWDSVYFHDWIGEGLNPQGDSKDSEGSDWLVGVFEKDDERPIYVQAWGGTITLVHALHRYRQKHGEEKFRQLLPKIRLFGILFQDISFEYFASFEKMRKHTCADFGTAIPTYQQDPVDLGMVLYDNGHFWHYVFGRDSTWQKPMKAEEVRGHGPMSELYDNGGEGDTPAFLYLLSAALGLNDPADPTQGSWGSRFKPMGTEFPDTYFSTCDVDKYELVRWAPAARNSFLNRLQWSVRSPAEVNHEPIASVNGDASANILYIQAKPGETVHLDASDSSDPDGDQIFFNWWRYQQADNYPGNVEIMEPTASAITLQIPQDIGDRVIHIVLTVEDNGTPALQRYKRVIIKST